MLQCCGAEFPGAADHAAGTVTLITLLLPPLSLIGARVSGAEDRPSTDTRLLTRLTQQHGARGPAVLVTLTQVTTLVFPLFVRLTGDCGGRRSLHSHRLPHSSSHCSSGSQATVEGGDRYTHTGYHTRPPTVRLAHRRLWREEIVTLTQVTTLVLPLFVRLTGDCGGRRSLHSHRLPHSSSHCSSGSQATVEGGDRYTHTGYHTRPPTVRPAHRRLWREEIVTPTQVTALVFPLFVRLTGDCGGRRSLHSHRLPHSSSHCSSGSQATVEGGDRYTLTGYHTRPPTVRPAHRRLWREEIVTLTQVTTLVLPLFVRLTGDCGGRRSLHSHRLPHSSSHCSSGSQATVEGGDRYTHTGYRTRPPTVRPAHRRLWREEIVTLTQVTTLVLPLFVRLTGDCGGRRSLHSHRLPHSSSHCSSGSQATVEGGDRYTHTGYHTRPPTVRPAHRRLWRGEIVTLTQVTTLVLPLFVRLTGDCGGRRSLHSHRLPHSSSHCSSGSQATVEEGDRYTHTGYRTRLPTVRPAHRRLWREEIVTLTQVTTLVLPLFVRLTGDCGGRRSLHPHRLPHSSSHCSSGSQATVEGGDRYTHTGYHTRPPTVRPAHRRLWREEIVTLTQVTTLVLPLFVRLTGDCGGRRSLHSHRLPHSSSHCSSGSQATVEGGDRYTHTGYHTRLPTVRPAHRRLWREEIVTLTQVTTLVLPLFVRLTGDCGGRRSLHSHRLPHSSSHCSSGSQATVEEGDRYTDTGYHTRPPTVCPAHRRLWREEWEREIRG